MEDRQAIDKQVEAVNRRLKAARLGLQIERRGEKLGLRGTLPPRPDSYRLKPYQQRIPLGLPATRAGLKEIEQTAKVIAAQLIQKTFDWREYLPIGQGKALSQADLSQQIDAFQQHFFTRVSEAEIPASVQTTWEKAYRPYLRKLLAMHERHPQQSLTELIYATIQGTRPNSRSRQVCCTALESLAEFLSLELPTDLKTFWGNYGNSRTQARELPSDEAILAAYDQIPNANWQFVFGMMATYGLRNHEVFFCDCSSLMAGDSQGMVEVLETSKTGCHAVWPFYPEWVERFDLRHPRLPAIETDLTRTTLQRVGQLVTQQFKRYQVPFSPYDLRHAWAVRTIHMGLPDTVAARMMGHSVAIHTRTYHRWITRRDQQQAVQAALSQYQRPAPL